jgi:acetyl esterase/lipase
VLDEASWQRFLNLLTVPDSEKRKGENFPVWGSLEGLLLANLAINGLDPIKDEGRLYEELLRKAGVQTRTDFYAGLPNMFVQFPQIKQTVVAGIELAVGIRKEVMTTLWFQTGDGIKALA